MSQKVNLKVISQERTIHCAGCEARIQILLTRLPGVEQVKAEYKTQMVHLTMDSEIVSLEQVREKLEDMGYKTAQ